MQETLDAPAADELARLHIRLAARDAELAHWRQQYIVVSSLWTSVQQSRWWRLAAPLRALRQLFAPRGFDERALIPWQDLVQIPGAPAGAWRSSGPDPQFFVPCLIPAGWVRVRLKMTSAVGGQVEFFADTGDGFLGAQCFERADCRGRLDVDFFTRFTKPVRGIRFDPLDKAGEFRLEQLRVDPVPLAQAVMHSLRARVRAGGGKWRALYDGVRWFLSRRAAPMAEPILKELPQPTLFRPVGRDMNEAYAACYRQRLLSDADRDRLRADIAALPEPPLFSILLPIAAEAESAMLASVESVRRQLYPHWELCIAVRSAGRRLAKLGRSDSRIRVVDAVMSATAGDYCAVLEPGDQLAEHALARAAGILTADRSIDLLYSDEDQVYPDGRHADPFFKPDWSPEYLLAFPYVGRLALYRTAAVRAAGGLRAECDPAAEYDLLLRLLARDARVRHLPEVLYHGKKRPDRASSLIRSRPASRESPEHFQRVSIIILVAGWPTALPSGGYALTRCVDSIRAKSAYRNYEVVVVHDPDVPDDFAQMLTERGATSVGYETPFHQALAVNRGAAQAGGDILLFLHDDVEVIAPNWIEALLEFAARPQIGAVGGRLFYPDGRLQHAGIALPGGVPGFVFQGAPAEHPGYFFSNVVPRNTAAVSGACLMTRADVFRSVGGFSEEFGLQYADVDYCLKIRQGGRRVVYAPGAELYHHEPPARLGRYAQELQTLQQRWGRHPDPYYNPNLSQIYYDYRL